MPLTGKDLISMGYTPGKWFAEAIEHINAEGLTGESLELYLATKQPALIEPLSTPLPFFLNIHGETPAEQENVLSVLNCMKEIMKTPTVVNGAVMPDACPTGAGQIPVGGVVVARNAIHPGWHSADICCSVMATYMGYADQATKKEILDFAQGATHFGPGGREHIAENLHLDYLMEMIRENPYLNSERSIHAAVTHMATQGDGNHFLFLGESKSNKQTCLVTHHGSRGFGAGLYNIGMKVAEKFRKEIAPNVDPKNAWIPYDTEEGKNYWNALQIIREWTKQNHLMLHETITWNFFPEHKGRFWNEHNFVFKDEDLFYHAKGATPLESHMMPDSFTNLRIIPLNMGQPVLIVEGRKTANNLGFAPHGAGRNMSRGAHKRTLAGQTDEEIFARETAGLDVRFYSGHTDISELPSAYKDAATVRDQMATYKLGRVVDEIMPYGCIMAGDWEKDAPWRKRKAAKLAGQ